MNRTILKRYAPQARRDFIQAVTDRASYYGLTKKKTEPVTVEGDTALIGGWAFPKKVAQQRKRLEERIARQGFEQVMEAVAYTWFNRLVAIRFMELHGYLEHGYRVLSHPEGKATPEILEHADSVDLPGLDPKQVIDLKLAGDKDAELYRMLLIAQCNALHSVMPFLFERIDDETELLLPGNLLHSDSLIRKLVQEIPEEDWQEVEIIGWLYQFYISEKKEQVIGKVVKSEDIPAATQLFTPNWIVKYLVQNSLGWQWVATYPDSPLLKKPEGDDDTHYYMEYYIEPAEQTPEVQEQLKAITPDSLNPEELTLLDPACGSGHILVEAYDLLKAIYLERGYPKKDIPRLILTKNLYGLEIDDRAAQLAAFALMMKARADDRRIFAVHVQPHVLSIQESKGLDAREITEALNQPILKEKLPPSGELFEEIADEKSPLFSRKNLAVKGDIAQADITHLIDLFEHGKTFGSLIQVPENLAKKLPAIAQRVEDVLAHGGIFEQAAARSLLSLCKQATVVGGRYDAVVTNPPYMASLFGRLKKLATTRYSSSRPDLFAMFIERGFAFTKASGCMAMITMHSWMFLKSFSQLRQTILEHWTINSMAHLGPRAFPAISGEVVQTTAFSLSNLHIPLFRPTFFRLLDGDSATKRDNLLARRHRYVRLTASEFSKIPLQPIAYWMSDAAADIFRHARLLSEVAEPRKGMVTSDNPRFIRTWAEVSHQNIGFGVRSREESQRSGKKWFPYHKGGEFRLWYGNQDHVVNWHNDGHELLHLQDEGYKVGSTNHNLEYIFKPAIVWTKITSSPNFRYSTEGFLFDDASGLCPVKSSENMMAVLGLLNSPITPYYLNAFNPTLNLNPGNLVNVPFLPEVQAISGMVESLVALAKADWDDRETSWDFSSSPLVRVNCVTIERAVDRLISQQRENRAEMIRLHTSLNQQVIDLYGLHGDLSATVDETTVSFLEQTPCELCEHVISYAIGCMMGRYSLDKPGLIYAHSGGKGFDPSQYQTFPADEDGIIPVTKLEWFEDDAANRLEKFLATAWPMEHLEENLKFVADSLGPNKGERPRETIRRYLATGFYKHHLQLYKRRPIYWLFSSGKQRAFQCLVYLHRYNAGTLSRMRTEYVIPLQGKIASRIDQLEGDIAAASSSTSRQKKLIEERDILVKHREELQTFDEKLRHYADQRITLDLDDGVKVNYGKFGDLLAEVKAITGTNPNE